MTSGGFFIARKLALIAAIIACAAVTSITSAPAPLRIPAGVLLMLLSPGYACAALLFGRRLRFGDRLLVSLALSMALMAMLALVLNLTPWGLSTGAWSASVAVLSVLGIVAAPEGGLGTWRPWRRIGMIERVLFVAAAVTILVAIAVARTPVSAGVHGYSELWVAHDASSARRVVVGVRSDEKQRRSYRLVIASGGVQIVVRRFGLDPGTQMELSPTLPARRRNGPVTAVLYRGGSQSPYRRVRMVLGP